MDNKTMSTGLLVKPEPDPKSISPGVARAGGLEADLAHLPEGLGPTGPTGLEPGIPGW